MSDMGGKAGRRGRRKPTTAGPGPTPSNWGWPASAGGSVPTPPPSRIDTSRGQPGWPQGFGATPPGYRPPGAPGWAPGYVTALPPQKRPISGSAVAVVVVLALLATGVVLLIQHPHWVDGWWFRSSSDARSGPALFDADDFGNPSWAVSREQIGPNGEVTPIPTPAAVALVCAGVPFPNDLGEHAASGDRTVAFWFKQSGRTDDQDLVLGGGSVPGPKLVGDEANPALLAGIAQAGPVGWVACVSQLDRGPVRRCDSTDRNGDSGTIDWYGNSRWMVELREAATGKRLTRVDVDAVTPGGCPSLILGYSGYPPPSFPGEQPSQEQIAAIVHSVLG